MKQAVSSVGTSLMTAIFCTCMAAAQIAYAQPWPSFDCSKSASYVEKQICQSTTLSELDLKLDASYRTALHNLSTVGKKSLRSSQRSWLMFVKTVCDPALRPDISWRSTEVCLAEKLQERDRQLSVTTVKTATIAIYPFSQFTARQNFPNSMRSGPDVGFTTTQVSYPLIDGPYSLFKSTFNQAHARFAAQNLDTNPEGIDTDYSVDYKILKANANLLSIEVTGGFYAHGTPHGQYYSSVFHWLPKEGRALRSADVFDPSKPWQRTIQSFCYENLTAQLGQVWSSPDLQSFVERLGLTVLDPTRWTFDQTGLKVHFSIYEVAGYAQGQPEVVIPWEQLRDSIASGAAEIFDQ